MAFQGVETARGSARGPATQGRRTIPLREITPPHHCPRPVRLKVLSRAPYFRGLTETELDGIDRRMRTDSWAAGDLLYQAGEPAGALYVVAEGRVRLSQSTAAGTETVSDIMVPGELFGGMTTLGEPHHRQTASALVGSCTLRIDQRDFREVLAEYPLVGLAVLDDVAARLARAQSDISGQTGDLVSQRVATALLRLADKLGEDRGAEGMMLEVPLTRADLAGLARSTPESVSRVMSRWKREGVIESGRRWTALKDLPRLRDEAGGYTDAGTTAGEA
ncbi:Crp/Fnr family transcriptional regulator [Citricoccus sp. NPDC055426]|uniref:Crp/Fnr family transcriptional regulator n=1 Tax=Citricoccus sp. NPDC055426 TaxID=3155536 RepID=UPI0034473E6E